MAGREERVHMRMSTWLAWANQVDAGRIVGGTGTQQVVDDLEQLTREDGERLLLRPATVEQALVTGPPLRAAADRHQGRHVQGMAQRARAVLGQVPLACVAPAVMDAR